MESPSSQEWSQERASLRVCEPQELAAQLSQAADVVIPALYGAANGAAAVMAEMPAAGPATVGPSAAAVSLTADRHNLQRVLSHLQKPAEHVTELP